MYFGRNISNLNPLKCISMNNQECKIRPEIVNVNNDEPTFYPYNAKISKCSGSCNNINDLYSKMFIPDITKNINLKVFNLMSRTNETRYIKFYKTCKCKFRLNASVYNNKQRWNGDKCRCECKVLIDKGSCDQRFIWNYNNCECECDKLCDIGEYLDYENYKYRKKLIDKLVEECTKNVDEKDIYPAKLHSGETITPVCSSYTIYIILFSLFFTINIGIVTYFIYYKYINHDKKTVAKEGSILPTTIY